MIFAIFASSAFAMDFNCQKVVEETALYLHCQNRVASYPIPIHFFYPKNLDETKSINLNLHFHGHNLSGYDHFYKTKNAGEGYGDFGSFLVQSKMNGIVLVPESFGNCQTYDEVFKDDLRAIKILNEIQNLNTFKVSSVSFSGHSGAYRVLRKIFSISNLEQKINNEVIGVGLFDATYGQVDSIINFSLNKIDENNEHNFIFFDSFVDGAKGTTVDLSRVLSKKYSNRPNFYFNPVPSTNETVLDQHFKLLVRNGVESFLSKLVDLK